MGEMHTCHPSPVIIYTVYKPVFFSVSVAELVAAVAVVVAAAVVAVAVVIAAVVVEVVVVPVAVVIAVVVVSRDNKSGA